MRSNDLGNNAPVTRLREAFIRIKNVIVCEGA